ncbi:MAG: hypothetical protein VX278_13325 [Myxococcota bacterium]|nr:hypothetical protein [Myxococcota bacterium]
METEDLLQLSSELTVVKPGDRYWFAFGGTQNDFGVYLKNIDGQDESYPKVWYQNIEEKHANEDLAMGLAVVDQEGYFSFGSQNPCEDFVSSMVRFLSSDIKEYPNLRRLIFSSYTTLDDDGKVLDIQFDEDSWKGLARQVPKHLVRTLSGLEGGERLWFMFDASLSLSLPLIMIPCGEDPTGLQFKEACRYAIDGLSQRPIMGIAHYNRGNGFSFVSASGDDQTLSALVRWTKKMIDKAPALQILVQSRFLVTEGEKIQKEISATQAWTLLETPPDAKIKKDLDRVISEADPKNQYWFWSNPQSKILVLRDANKDPEGKVLLKKARHMMEEEPKSGKSVHGVINFFRGRLCFVTEGDADLLRPLLDYFARHSEPGIRQALEQSQILDSETSPEPLEKEVSEKISPPYIPLANALRDVDEGVRCWFWFAEKVRGDAPHLMLFREEDDPKKQKIRAWIKDAPQSKGAIRGSVVCKGDLQKGGFLLFQSQMESSQFIQHLAKWATESVSECSLLRKLANARFIQKNKEGETVDKQKNDALWTALLEEGQ